MLASVGRLDDSLAQALAAVTIDPDSPVINSRAAIAYTWLDVSDKAYEYFKRSDDLGVLDETHLLAYALLLSRHGRFDEARNIAIKATKTGDKHAAWVDPVFAAFADPSRAAEGLQALNAASPDVRDSRAAVELIARIWLGDVDGAMSIAKRLNDVGEIFEMDLLYIKEMQPLRDHPEFMPLLKTLGVVDYWAQANCSWNGQQASCDSN